MPYICQKSLPFSPWMKEATRRMPGVQPLVAKDYFFVDDAFKKQMKYRDQLLLERFDEVYANKFTSNDECEELLEFVISHLKDNGAYKFKKNKLIRPDGVEFDLDGCDPLRLAASFVQEDILLLKKEKDEHILKAGVLCFPASWSLSEKIERSLTAIHSPVGEYTDQIAPRIEKMFSNMRVDTPIWRSNFLLYEDYELYQPRLEQHENGNTHKRLSQFMRVERQTLVKLPLTEAVMFAIHTFVVPYIDLTVDQKISLESFVD
jgi:hypothetical protein